MDRHRLASGGEGGVGDRRGESPRALGGEVAAPDVAQLVFGVAVLAGRDRAQPDVGAVTEDAQDQSLGQLGRIACSLEISSSIVFRLRRPGSVFSHANT